MENQSNYEKSIESLKQLSSVLQQDILSKDITSRGLRAANELRNDFQLAIEAMEQVKQNAEIRAERFQNYILCAVTGFSCGAGITAIVIVLFKMWKGGN